MDAHEGTDGSVWIVSVQPEKGMPTDGIVWLNQGQRSSVPLNPQVVRRPLRSAPLPHAADGTAQEIEITVDTCGFVPGIGETMASRTRRRYRLARAPYGLIIIHYGRGPAARTRLPLQSSLLRSRTHRGAAALLQRTRARAAPATRYAPLLHRRPARAAARGSAGPRARSHGRRTAAATGAAADAGHAEHRARRAGRGRARR
jgi:hypothetical protein